MLVNIISCFHPLVYVLGRICKLCSMVWVLVGVLLLLVTFVISLVLCLELYNLVCTFGQNKKDIVFVNTTILIPSFSSM
jgi:hypothetical protein